MSGLTCQIKSTPAWPWTAPCSVAGQCPEAKVLISKEVLPLGCIVRGRLLWGALSREGEGSNLAQGGISPRQKGWNKLKYGQIYSILQCCFAFLRWILTIGVFWKSYDAKRSLIFLNSCDFRYHICSKYVIFERQGTTRLVAPAPRTYRDPDPRGISRPVYLITFQLMRKLKIQENSRQLFITWKQAL